MTDINLRFRGRDCYTQILSVPTDTATAAADGNLLLLEDGTSNLLMEDGTTTISLEA